MFNGGVPTTLHFSLPDLNLPSSFEPHGVKFQFIEDDLVGLSVMPKEVTYIGDLITVINK
jgi:hypothetical protein